MTEEEKREKISYWREHPAEFAEEVFGLNLSSFQKQFLEGCYFAPIVITPRWSDRHVDLRVMMAMIKALMPEEVNELISEEGGD